MTGAGTTGRLGERVAIVTGAGGAIERAICVAFAAEGAKVVCSDINGDTAEATAARIMAAGGSAIGRICDVHRGDHARDAINAALEWFGALHILVHNAAVFPRHATAFLASDDSSFMTGAELVLDGGYTAW